jgi:hypothetical protein
MAVMAAESSSPSPPPTSKLQNTSFTLTRLTPLYSLNTSRLTHYAREFRDIVRGDIIRGVHINTQPSERAKSALVRSCTWTIENDILPTETFDGLIMRVSWDDGSTFIAILLPDFTSVEPVTLGKRKRGSDAEFTPFPLLLTRGPQLVTQQLITYLTTRFDSRASELEIPADLLEKCLQGYLEILFREDNAQRTIEQRLKILELIFSTPQPANPKVKGALRRITLTLGVRDVQELYRRLPLSFTRILLILDHLR